MYLVLLYLQNIQKYVMYFVFSYFICPVYCSIDTNACQYVRIKKLLYKLMLYSDT